MKTKNIVKLIIRVIPAFILLSTLYFKFTGQPESVALFTKLGIEPWGRFGTGVLELIASIFLIIRPTALPGALLSIGLMLGAIYSHLFVIGIESGGDNGQLFIMACIVLFTSIIVAILYRKDVAEMTFIPAGIRKRIAGIN